MANLGFNYGTRNTNDGADEAAVRWHPPLILACLAIGAAMFLVGRLFSAYVAVMPQ